MNGMDLARRLLEIYPNLAVILMSGYIAEDLDDFADRGRSVAFLQKPFTPSQLRAMVRTTLNRRPQRPAEEDGVF
jgi:DNA-binding NtrC family response regulator